MTTENEPPDLSDAVTAIGRLAIAFAMLEGRMHQLAWQVIDDQRGMGPRITDGMSAGEIGGLLKRIAVFSAEETRINDLVAEFTAVSKTRNTAMHPMPDGADALHNLRDRLREALGRELKTPISVQATNEAAFECQAIAGRLTQVLEDLRRASAT